MMEAPRPADLATESGLGRGIDRKGHSCSIEQAMRSFRSLISNRYFFVLHRRFVVTNRRSNEQICMLLHVASLMRRAPYSSSMHDDWSHAQALKSK